MKRLVFTFLVISLALSVKAATNLYPFMVTWIASPSTYTGPTNVNMQPESYYLYVSTDITQPMTNWLMVSNFPASMILPTSSNVVAVTSQIVYYPFPAPVFATIQYSNVQGAAPFSVPAGCQGPAVNGVLKGIRPAQ